MSTELQPTAAEEDPNNEPFELQPTAAEEDPNNEPLGFVEQEEAKNNAEGTEAAAAAAAVAAVAAENSNNNTPKSASSPSPSLRFRDHWTLRVPSSTVRFRGTKVYLNDQGSSQLQITEEEGLPGGGGGGEDDGDDDNNNNGNNEHVVWVKDVKNSASFGLLLLRATYTLMTVFFTIILFTLCVMILVFLFMDVVSYADTIFDQAGKAVVFFLGSLLAVPYFILGLSSAMALACAAVMDSWNGNAFLRTIGNWSLVFTEWATLLVFLVVPMLTWIITTFLRLDNWWELVFLTWFISVTLFYVYFACAVIFYEAKAGVEALQELEPDIVGNWRQFIATAVRVRLTATLSGTTRVMAITTNEKNTDQEDEDNNQQSTALLSENHLMGLYGRMTRLRCCGCLFERLDQPKLLHDFDDILGTRYFITSNTWSLERIFCENIRSRSVMIVQGPSALEPHQMLSSLICSIGASLLLVLMLASLLVWLGGTGVIVAVIVVVVLLCFIPVFRQNVQIFRTYLNILRERRPQAIFDEGGEEPSSHLEESGGIFQTFDSYRVSRPTKHLCWAVVVLEFLFLFLWPIVSLFYTKNYAVAVLFLVMVAITTVQSHLNAGRIIQELGSLPSFHQSRSSSVTSGRSSRGTYGDRNWKAASRTTSILQGFDRGIAKKFWIWIFVFVALVIFLFALGSLATSFQDNIAPSPKNFVMLNSQDFAYLPQPNMQYQSCSLYKGLDLPEKTSTSLVNYAFLCLMSYQSPETVQPALNEWFGEGVATFRPDISSSFRSQVEGGAAAVSYRFVTFAPDHDFGVVIVRGSTTAWEWLTNCQIWLTSLVAQLGQLILPIGEAYTPIIDELLVAVSGLQTEQLNRIALYKQTTSFVEHLKASGNYTSGLHITGHSLGGGTAMITGAQTRIPAVAISGPNSMLARKTLDPPISEEDINQYVFNIIPKRDMVPMVGGRGTLIQDVECRADKSSLMGCHKIERTLCELSWSCGTSNEIPVLCECATMFGFEEPFQTGGNASFAEVCAGAATKS